MRIFNSAVEMYDESFREIWKRGQIVFDKTVQGKVVGEEEFEQKEIVCYSYMLTKFDDIDDMMTKASETFNKEHLRPDVAVMWFDDMMTNDSLKERWWGLSPFTYKYYNDFCDEDGGNSSYSYGERIIPQFDALITRLKKNIYSRGAQITIFDNRDISRIGRRVPCTNTYHFIVRKTIDGDKMNLIVDQRSCDMINFFPLDLYKAYLLLQSVAGEVGVDIGYIIHQIHSAHVYKMDIPNNYKW